MIYFALISYPDPYEDSTTGVCREDVGFITLVVEASSPEKALEKYRERLVKLHDEDEIFFDVNAFYLEDLVELDNIPIAAKQITHFIPRLFDKMPSLILRSDPEGDEALRHYNTTEADEGNMEPLLDIDRDRRLSRPLYKSLLKKKSRGILPSFKELSDGDVYELFVVEGCIRAEIAELFDITLGQLDYRRNKVDATLLEEALYNTLVDQGILDPFPYKKEES